MNYELKSSIRRKKIALPIKITLLVTIVLVAFQFIFPTFLSSVVTAIVSPVWKVNIPQYTGLDQLSDNVKDTMISQLKKENIELKEIMGRLINKNAVIAYIIKKPPFTAYDSFILDIGTNSRVKKGDKVYVQGNFLIGEIAEVFSDTSRVKLFSSYGEKYDVLIGDKNIQATATGRGGGSFEVVIPRDLKVIEGDSVSIPNIMGSTFGIVGKVIADPARAFSTVLFSQPINIYEQKWVQIYEETKPN